MGKFHTNPGGKYVYRGSGSKFHTNPGGKYAYRGWSGKYDNHHHYGHYRRYGYYPWYGLPLYSYGGNCTYLYRRAVVTGSAYWWDRYRRCSGVSGLLLPALDREDPEGRVFVADLPVLLISAPAWGQAS